MEEAMKSMNRRSTLAFGITAASVLTVCGGLAFAQHTDVTLLTPDKLVWKDNPGLPKGAQTAILVGDPTKAGDVVVLRAKFPADYQVPPHTHPYAETITVINRAPSTRSQQIMRITSGRQAKRVSSKFILSGREVSTTSTLLTIRARSEMRLSRLVTWRILVARNGMEARALPHADKCKPHQR
jgi:hypothetical protein